MAPTADSLTLFLVIKLVINDLRIYISSLLPLWQLPGQFLRNKLTVNISIRDTYETSVFRPSPHFSFRNKCLLQVDNFVTH